MREYENENNKKIRSIERQRNISMALTCLAIGFAVSRS
nr:MAG TPA: hypothetical protein [Caudoviricetes sp.]